jgi:hypothetical protein
MDAIAAAVAAAEKVQAEVEESTEEVDQNEESDVVEEESDEEGTEESDTEDEDSEEDDTEVELKGSPQLKAIEKREKRLKEQEVKLKELYKAESDRVEELKKEVLPYLDDVKKFQELKKSVNLNPVEVLKSLGVTNLKGVAEYIWVELMGDKAPPEWKAKAKELEIQRQIDHLASKQDVKKEEPDNGNAELDAYVDNLSSYLEEVNDAPFVKELYEEDSERALETLYQAADALYRQNPHLGIPTAEDAAKYLEDYLAAEHEKAAARYNKLKGKSESKTKTISTKKAQVRKSKTKNKPLTEDERIANAIMAAQDTLA